MNTFKDWFLLLTVVMSFSLAAVAQEIKYSHSDAAYQFSGLAKWKDKILLIPQYNDLDKSFNIITIDTTAIDDYLKSSEPKKIKLKDNERLSLTTVFIDSLKSIINFDLGGIKNKGAYGGFEAAVVNEDMIYFTVETDSPFCFIIEGHIKIDSVHFLNKIKLPKPDKCFENAGFESILYLKNEKKLLALYEKNRDTANPSAFLIDESLQNPPVPVKFKKPLLFRLTDVASIDGENIIAINHYFNDCKDYSCEEFNYYIGSSNRKEAKREMRGADPKTSSFTRLIKMRLNGNVIDWNVSVIIPIKKYDWDYNWEGMIPFKNGVLMIVDGMPSSDTKPYCILKYFKRKQ